MNRLTNWVASLAVAAITLSCGKDEPSPVTPPGDGGTGGDVNWAARSAVFDALTEKISTLPNVDPDADNQTLLAFIQARPEFEASGIKARSVWARFRDGRLYVFVNNLSSQDSVPAGLLAASPLAGPTPRGALGPAENLPTNNGARVMNSLGSAFDYSGVGMIGFTRAADDIRGWLKDVGYTPVSSTPTVDGLRGVSGDGVFYLSAHGAEATARTGEDLYGVWTATEVDSLNDLKYAADLDAGALVYFDAAHEKGGIFSKDVVKRHYAITFRFVINNMQFGNNCLVFINACRSYNQEFLEACMQKGAGLYLGWSEYAEPHAAVRAARYLFDRSLGANAADPVLSPPQKGYQIYDVLGKMNDLGIDVTVTRGVTAELKSFPLLSDLTMLRPLVYALTSTNEELRIIGWFGQNPGQGAATVRIGTTVLPIKEWKGETTLVCEPVTAGGDVVVSVRGRRSTPAPLTQWRGTVDYTLTGPGTLKQRITLTLELVGDVRSNRVQVDETPSFGPPRLLYAVPSTTGNYSASGEHRDNQGNLVDQWSGSGTLSLMAPGTLGTGVAAAGVVDKSGYIQSTITASVSAPYTRKSGPATMSIYPTLSQLMTSMDNSFTLSGGTFTAQSGNESATITWSSFTPTHVPTNSTPH